MGLGLVIVVVLARSFAALYWADVHFDADQAVTGLMAKHVAEGRAFPVFQYAHRYVLVLEAWLAAPLAAVAEGSIPLLKSVPVALNVATSALLYSTLTSTTALGPVVALFATAPLAVPGPPTTRGLTDAIGMNIEPLLFALVLWWWRERPVALGIAAALAVKNREFALYAVVALLVVDLLRDRSAKLWRGRIVALVAFAVTWSSVDVLTQYSSPFGPGTTVAMVGGSEDTLPTVTVAACVDLRLIPRDVWRVVTELLPYQFGVSTGPWSTDRVYGADPQSVPWLWAPLVAVLAFGMLRGLRRAWRHGATPMTWFGLYLVLVGLLAVLVYAVTRCGHVSVLTLRYTLLSLLAPVGALTLGLEREPRSWARGLLISVVALWVGMCALAHASLVRGFIESPPRGAYRQLAAYLSAQDVHFIVTDYWTGYHVAFLTGERIKALTDYQRIHDYTLAVRANLDRAVEVRRDRDERCDGAVVVARFYVCPPNGSLRQH